MNIRKRIIAFLIAFLIAVSPLQQSLVVSADNPLDLDIPSDKIHVEDLREEDDPESEEQGTVETAAGTETGEGTEEEKPDIGPAEPAASESTGEPTEASESDGSVSEEGKENGSRIVAASTPDEYFELISDFPDCGRIIVDTDEDLSFIEVSFGIYFDGTYILGFENDEDLYKAVEKLAEKGIEYAVDGTFSVCGDNNGPVLKGRINPDAKVKVAVIDTGSNLANESYSVRGDDTEDHNGHGTAMCESILNETDNAYIISIKALGDDGRGNMSDVYVAVQMAEELGVDYILMAVSVRNIGKYDAFISLIGNTGAVVVASAGNNGSDAAKYLPAGISGVITVGALEEDGTLRASSNYGDSVDYYVIAGSTSEAASTALGMMVDGRTDELAKEYAVPSDTAEEHTEPSAEQTDPDGDTYQLVLRAEDDDVMFATDNVHDSGITVYQRQVYHQSDYFSHPYNDGFGVYSDSNSGTLSWDSHVLYCIEDTKKIPDDLSYGDREYYGSYTLDSDMKLIQAACAFGPTGELYEYGVQWWKEHDTGNEILPGVKNDSRKMRIAMYAITHFVVCKAYDGKWPDSTPGDSDSVPQVFVDYYNFLKNVRNGKEDVPGYVLSDWWCEIYRCSGFSSDDKNKAYQLMARGNVTKNATVDVSFTVGKSSSASVDPGYLGFAGTTYTLYGTFGPKGLQGDYELQDPIMTFVMREDGTTGNVYQATTGAVHLYMKETAAAHGYALDDTIYWIYVYADGSVSSGVMEYSAAGNMVHWREADAPGKVTVTGGAVSTVNVKDAPDKAVFSLDKKLGSNYSLLSGQSYGFELWDNTSDSRVATGTAAVPSDAGASSSTPVAWKGIANGYSSASDNRLIIIPGHTYQVMETTMTVNGSDLETPPGWTKGNAHGKACFYQTFTAGAGKAYQFTATNNVTTVQLSLTKASADVSITAGNSAYSLSGAKYVLSSDAVFSAEGMVGSFTMKSDGTADTRLRVNRGKTYYLKETVAGKGYELDGSVYKIVIASDGLATVSTHSGQGKASVTNGDPIVVSVKDMPKTTEFTIGKSSSNPSLSGTVSNSIYSFAGTTYELYSNLNGTGIVASFVMKSNGTCDTAFRTPYGKTYYLKETVAGKGFDLDAKTYTVSVSSAGAISVNNGAAVDNGGNIKILKVSDNPKPAYFSLTKQLGDNYSLLAGRTYNFELWDNTAGSSGVKVAAGKADVPSTATTETLTAVVWSDVNTAGGYKASSDNRLEIIPGHTYQILETTISVNGRVLETPSGWTSGNAHGKPCFYKTFTAGTAGQTYSFNATNFTDVRLGLIKASADPAVTDGNSAYSLAGARYVLAKDASFSSANTIGSFTLNADGSAGSSLKVSCGVTYYLKETAAAKGYKLDNSVYKIVIGIDGKATVTTSSGTGKASVIQGSPIVINVKDIPETTEFTVRKDSSDPSLSGDMPNSIYDLAGTAYELYSDPKGTVRVASFVMRSDGTTAATFTAPYGRTYYLKETVAGKGFELDAKTYTVTISSTGSVSVNNGAVIDNGNTIKIIKVTDTPKTAYFSLTKQLGNNWSLLAGQTYKFELWDNTANVRVAAGSAAVPSNADRTASTAVIWSGIAGGYSSSSGNRLVIIPGHAYQVMETTMSVKGFELETPSGWTKGNAHGKDCFYRTFTAGNAGQTYSFTAINTTSIPLSLTKSSSDPGITDGNAAYSPAGSKYILAKDASFSAANTVGTFTVKADGSTDRALKVSCGAAYYLKETAAAPGYELDASVYKVVIGNDGKAVVSTYSGTGKASVTQGNPVLVNVKDTPKQTSISLTKESSYPSVTEGNSCYSLAGTSYGLYASKSDAESGKNELVVFNVDADGNTRTMFTADYGKTYYLKEISAGKGYKKDNRTYTVSVAADGTVSTDNGVTVRTAGKVSKIGVKDEPGTTPLDVSLRKTAKNGSTVHNADVTGAVFRISYYAQDLGTEDAGKEATVIYNVKVKGDSAVIGLSDLKSLKPAGGSNPEYLKNLPAGCNGFPYGTLRIQEIVAPAGYRLNDQIIRYRLGATVSYSVEKDSAYGNRNYWKQLPDGTLELTELPEAGYYQLTKSLDDTMVRSELSGFRYQIWNMSSSSSPVLIASGSSQKDGRVLWTYTVPDYYQNADPSILLTGKTTYRLELPASEKNTDGSETAVLYQVREIKSSIGICYEGTDIPYTNAVPVTAGKAWNSASSYYWKDVTVSDETVTREGVTNDYLYTGLSVNKVVPADNPFDVTRVTFMVYNTDGGRDTLIANGSVDSNGNVTWYRATGSGAGMTATASVNVLNCLPLGHYRVEETWMKNYIDGNGIPILIEEKNNNGWTKTETNSTYIYSYDVDLSDVSNDGKITYLAVENEKEVQEFNLVKNVSVDGDASEVTAELYLISGDSETRVATGRAMTTGKGSFGFTWEYSGEHKTRDGLDTLVLPVGQYRLVETCPVTYYKDTEIPYTYKTPEGYTARRMGGTLQFFRDFELKSGDYVTENMAITNVRIEGSFDIIKVERSGGDLSRTFTFEVYYRGNGKNASDNGILIEKVKITTEGGKGSASLTGLPEGWYEIRETGAGSGWITHWINDATVSNGNKVVRLGSGNRSDAAPVIDDGVRENGNAVNAVVVYNDKAPSVRTVLTDHHNKDHVSSCSVTATLEDNVSYSNLLPGHYVITGVLMDKDTGKELLDGNGKSITGSKSFDVAALFDEYGEAVPQSGTVKVTYTLDTTIIRNVTVVAFEELHRTSAEGELVAAHKDISDAAQTVYIPEIGTSLTDDETDSHVTVCSENAKLVDTVTYSNLMPGKTYILSGELIEKSTGKSLGITASKEFTPQSSSGTETVEFTVDTTLLKGKKIVAFEKVSFKGHDVAVHAEIGDADQTVRIPSVRTTLVDAETEDHVASYGAKTVLVDTVSYSNLIPGREYTVNGELMDKKTGKPLGITASNKFTPSSSSGTVRNEFTADTVKLAGSAIVAFETVTYGDSVIAVHEDINDVDQTVTIPGIRTTLLDTRTQDHISACSKTATLVDTVSYTDLIPGREYEVTGTLINKTTGRSLGITGAKRFTPSESRGTVEIVFTVDTTLLKGVTVVAFETVRYKGIEVAVHSDINDAEQTLDIPGIGTSLVDRETKEHISVCSKTAVLVDTVTYTNLIPGKKYALEGILMNRNTGKPTGVTATKKFTPASSSGEVKIEFTVDTSILKGVTVVAFETLRYKDADIAVHANINDEGQTVVIPEIRTTIKDKGTGDKVAGQSAAATLVDTVTYTNLIAGKTYTVTGTLVDKETGRPLGITGETSFTAEKPSGSVDIEFTFDSTLLSGRTIVAFETLKYKEKEIAVHADINDREQTVYVPEIRTVLTDTETEDHVATFKKTAVLVDAVSYGNLVAGKEYTLTGTLIDKKTGKELKDPKGNVCTVTRTFTAENEIGTVDMEFTVDTTTINNVTAVAFEKLYHNGVLIAGHTDINDVDQTVHIPEIRTTLKDTVTEEHVAAEDTVTLIDTVKYTNLLPGREYTVSGVLMNKESGEKLLDGNGDAITGSINFTPEAPEGSVDIVFRFSSELLRGVTAVAFEELEHKEIKVAVHADINDEEQTVYFPEIHTVLTDMSTGGHVAAQGERIRLTDTVSYNNLKTGLDYTMKGTLYVKSTEETLTDAEGNPVTASVEFTPDADSGFVELVFEFDSELLKGESLVAFEELDHNGKSVATHNDISDRGQTVDIPEIHTSFFDAAFGPDEDLVRCDSQVELTDRVFYQNLTPGLEYKLYMTVMVKETGKPLLEKDGKAVAAEKTFVPETLDGYVDISVTADTSLIEGESLVAFETLDHKNITLVIHADINDREQTVNIPKIRTTATDADNKTHTLTYKEKVNIVDNVAYENLVPGKTYRITGTLYDKETGEVYKNPEGNAYKVSKEFVAASSLGSETVEFKDVIVPFSKAEIVAFEELAEKETGIILAVHSDLNDEEQTVRRPEVSTSASILNSKEIWLESTAVTDITVSDRVSYEGFEAGRRYRIEATLYKTDGTQIKAAGQPLVNIVEFVPETSNGELTVNTTFSNEGLAEGDRIVVFEKFYDVASDDECGIKNRTREILVSRHEDLANESQTVTVHYRPQTGGITPAYSTAGTVIASVAVITAMIWFVISRKEQQD